MTVPAEVEGRCDVCGSPAGYLDLHRHPGYFFCDGCCLNPTARTLIEERRVGVELTHLLYKARKEIHDLKRRIAKVRSL